MEPLSIFLGATVLAAFGVSGGVVGVTLGRYTERRAGPQAELHARIRDLERSVESRDREIDQKDRSMAYYEDRQAQDRETIETLERQKNEYLRMAQTHEVTLPEVPDSELREKVLWEGKRFCGHPSANLVNLRKELEEYKNWEVAITIQVSGENQFSSWGNHIAKAWSPNSSSRGAVRSLGPWVYHGPLSRALDDFETQIKDDDSGFMKRTKGKGKVWRDEDSPILFEVSVKLVERFEPKVPEYQIVEVPVVEVQREVIEVEKPVFISVPEGQEPELCGHSQEEIRQMVKDELQRHDAEREVESLGQLAGLDVKAEQERMRKAKAQRADRQRQ